MPDLTIILNHLGGLTRDGFTDIVTWGVPPGMRPEQMAPSLERFAREVAPRLKSAVG